MGLTRGAPASGRVGVAAPPGFAEAVSLRCSAVLLREDAGVLGRLGERADSWVKIGVLFPFNYIHLKSFFFFFCQGRMSVKSQIFSKWNGFNLSEFRSIVQGL